MKVEREWECDHDLSQLYHAEKNLIMTSWIMQLGDYFLENSLAITMTNHQEAWKISRLPAFVYYNKDHSLFCWRNHAYHYNYLILTYKFSF